MGEKSRSDRTYPPLSKTLLERVDRAWDALEDGYVEEAGQDAEELMDETDEHPEVRFLFGAALLESGAPGESLEHLLACEGQVDDPVVHQFYLASALFENLRPEEAETLFEKVLGAEPDAAPAHYGLAQALEFTGRYDEADVRYERAHELEPDGFPLPTRMTEEAFEEVVREALQDMPEELRPHVSAVDIVVEAMPPVETLIGEPGEDPITPGVLGLFVGPNLRERGDQAPASLPPRVYVYQRNLERFCRTREELIYEIRLTVFHELGHYLGLSEEELEQRGLL
jgi:predicted Zn-dependent protease with MMP-like domain